MSIFDKLKKEKKANSIAPEADASVNIASQDKATDKKVEVADQTEKKEVLSAPAGKKIVKTDAKKSDKQSGQVYGILIRPLVTEKASNLAKINQYAFEVGSNANKIQITAAIEKRYGIKPISVNVINNRSRKVRFGRTTGKTKAWRKAMVTLPKGKTIQIHDGL